MKTFALFLVSLLLLVSLVAFAQEEEAADTLVFEAKMGNVTFDHKAHTDRVEGDCAACHDSLFPKSREPINYKEKMHRTAEAEKTSCGACHHPGGKSFESKGNCKNCHVK